MAFDLKINVSTRFNLFSAIEILIRYGLFGNFPALSFFIVFGAKLFCFLCDFPATWLNVRCHNTLQWVECVCCMLCNACDSIAVRWYAIPNVADNNNNNNEHNRCEVYTKCVGQKRNGNGEIYTFECCHREKWPKECRTERLTSTCECRVVSGKATVV